MINCKKVRALCDGCYGNKTVCFEGDIGEVVKQEENMTQAKWERSGWEPYWGYNEYIEPIPDDEA